MDLFNQLCNYNTLEIPLSVSLFSRLVLCLKLYNISIFLQQTPVIYFEVIILSDHTPLPV